MHEPPDGSQLSQASGPLSGNVEWRECIERFFRKVTVFGHDHETPIKNRRWHQRLPSRSVLVNIGQTPAGPFQHCVIEMEFNQSIPCLVKKVKITAYPIGRSVTLPGA